MNEPTLTPADFKAIWHELCANRARVVVYRPHDTERLADLDRLISLVYSLASPWKVAS